jgi:BCD family chlorophyll transporter-like MFS transporter
LLLADFSQLRLIKVVQGAAAVTLALNLIALWKQEARNPDGTAKSRSRPDFGASWQSFVSQGRTLRFLVVVGLGTAAFSMQDIILEPYGGEILKLSVSSTTMLTFTLALGGLMGFAWASRVITRGADPYQMASWGALTGLPAFMCVILAAPLMSVPLFVLGIFLIGLGGGLFAHGTLTATMQMAPSGHIGLAMGAWGAVQATAAGVGMALGGMVRDGVALVSNSAMGYSVVYGLEILLLGMTLWAMKPLIRPWRASVNAA